MHARQVMRRALSLLHLAVALGFVLPACSTVPEAVPAGGRPRGEPKTVRVSELAGGGLRLAFEPVAPDPARVRVEEARAVLADFHGSFPREEGRRFRLVRTGTGPEPAQWERRLREE
ncbi:MAG TPA: hypothetical protein VEZ71_08865, partial [Archangium sp.]|nr:hypothetical protein [Archangium sp.]